MRVVLTFARGTLPGLADALQAEGFDAVERPLVSFEPPSDWTPLDQALSRLAKYSAVALTSRRAAAAIAERLSQTLHPSIPAWVAGPGTAEALGGRFAAVHTAVATAELGAAEALAAAMLAARIGSPVLYPCGDPHRDELIDRLGAAGVTVDVLIAYRSILATPAAARIALSEADLLVVASPSVAGLAAVAADRGQRPALIVIGPTTRTAAGAAGWTPDAVAEQPTVGAVVAAVRTLR